LIVSWTGFLAGLAEAQLPPTPDDRAAGGPQLPKLYVAERSKDLGRVYEGDKVSVTWNVENRGDADLVIDHVAPSCGCTVVKLEEAEKTIPPGKPLALTAEFDSTARRGAQAKFVAVYSNDPTEPEIHLDFKAQVELLYEFDPANMMNLRAVRRGDQAQRTLDVYPGKGHQSLTVRGVELDDDAPLSIRGEPFEGRLAPVTASTSR